jgi:endoglucanase
MTVASASSNADPDAFAYNRLLGRGMNIGNALDAPREGAWGVTLKSEFFQAIKDAGFNSVRIPIRWSAHALMKPPYTIDPTFFARVDWAIDQVLSRNLAAVIDMHHYVEMDRDPWGHAPRLLALWKQISARCLDRPATLFFELFNEPHNRFTDQRWSRLFPQLLRTIREDHSKRMVIVGAGDWNAFDRLRFLELPQNDRQLIVTFHYYHPKRFTHQAQGWLPESRAWKGTMWGTAQEHDELRENFERAAAWGRQYQRPLYLGEFGSSENADTAARVAWTRAVAREAKKLDFSWSYWQFCSNFGVYDPTTHSWNQPLLQALLDR